MNTAKLLEYIKSSAEALSSGFTVKSLISAVLIFLSTTLQFHFQLFCGFIVLVVFDLFTKWISLSEQALEDSKSEDLSLLNAILNIKRARKLGYIKSDAMKTRFLSKILVYLLAVFAGAVVDIMLAKTGSPTLFVKLIISYLASSELLSVLENLEDSGVTICKKLRELIKRKTGF